MPFDRDRLPSTMSLRYCSACPRTDRFTQLKDRHYSAGKLCSGDVRVAVYRFDHVASRKEEPSS